jgi:hypothetical protein
MRAAVATALSLAGVLVAGSAAALVNTQVLSGTDDASTVGSLASTTSVVASTTSSIAVAPPSSEAGSTQSTYQVGEAGLVTVDTSTGALTLVSVAPNPGWAVASTGAGPLSGIEVHLSNGTVDVRFIAVLADGSVVVDVSATEIGAPSSSIGGFDDDDDDHGDDDGEHEDEDEDEDEHEDEHEDGEGHDDDD